MSPGDTIEAAIWITGDEPADLRARFEADVVEAIARETAAAGYTHGPVQFTEKHPLDDRVPEVPDHIQGSRVRLLVAEAAIVARRVVSPAGSFIANLDRRDLDRLRVLTRREAAKHGRTLTDAEADALIEEIGPEAAIDTLRRAVGDTLPRVVH